MRHRRQVPAALVAILLRPVRRAASVGIARTHGVGSGVEVAGPGLVALGAW
ncbi:hypothetical protein GGQ54_001282 [Naumannella cuiyingiana]|uniref:Uncharacterized protein n=1 Tax=Naumannella cuiyingiana TaxID=1347891 RepID=A0A7Z0D8A1_9ACTN|nr:hypothetical protein [Naumannella cuiyingiana]